MARARTQHIWTGADEIWLRKLFAQGLSDDRIASLGGLPKSAVANRRRRLGLYRLRNSPLALATRRANRMRPGIWHWYSTPSGTSYIAREPRSPSDTPGRANIRGNKNYRFREALDELLSKPQPRKPKTQP